MQWDGRGILLGELKISTLGSKMLMHGRQWAIVIPCYLMVLVLLTYLVYGGLTAYMTPSFDSPILITGE